jgi:capsular polysaccharide biosynthesis protein
MPPLARLRRSQEPVTDTVRRTDPPPGTAADFERQIAIVSRWLLVILVCGAVAAGISGFVASRSPAAYASRAAVLIGPAVPLPSAAPLDLVLAGRALTPTYAELAGSARILEDAIEISGVQTSVADLKRQLIVEMDDDAAIVAVTVTWGDPEAASRLANGIATALERYAARLPNAASGLTALVIEPAAVPTTPAGPGMLIRILLGGAIGVGIAVAIAFLTENVLAARGQRRARTEAARADPARPEAPRVD